MSWVTFSLFCRTEWMPPGCRFLPAAIILYNVSYLADVCWRVLKQVFCTMYSNCPVSLRAHCSRWSDLWVICFHYGNMQFSPSFHYDNIMTVILWTDEDAFFSPPLCPDIGLNAIEMTELSVIHFCRFSQPEWTNAATWSGYTANVLFLSKRANMQKKGKPSTPMQ